MKKTRFTPGPWHIRVPRKGHRKCHSISDSNNNDTIAYIYYRRKPGERDSNIALLAAAPEMYEIVAKLEEMAFSGCASVEDVQNLIQRAMFVAKKARGEE